MAILTQFDGIYQSDVIIRTAIITALEELKEKPYLLDYVYAGLPLDTLSSGQYGELERTKAKQWFLNNNVVVLMDYKFDGLSFPCITVGLESSTEVVNEDTLGDVHNEPQEPADGTDVVPTIPAPVLGPFNPLSYNISTGLLTLPSPLTTDVLFPGMLVHTVTGNNYQIQTINDNTSFFLLANTQDNFSGATIGGELNQYVARIESLSVREVYSINCYVHGDPVLLTYMHSLVTFILLRSKQSLFEPRGFERSTIAWGKFMRSEPVPGAEAEVFYMRPCTLTGYARHYWPKNITIQIAGANVNGLLVGTTQAAPPSVAQQETNQGWFVVTP